MKTTYLTIGIIALLGIGVFYSCNPKVANSKSQKNKSESPVASPEESENPYIGLRQMALDMTSEQLEIQTSDDKIKAFGIVMDWDVGDGIVTLSSYETGDASLYFSTGGGVLGGGQHKEVRLAVFGYLKVGQEYLTKTTEFRETPLPKRGKVVFYFLTNKGKFLAEESMSKIESGNSEWTRLFEEANRVLSELRIISEKEDN